MIEEKCEMRRRTFCAAMALTILGTVALTPPSSAQSYPSQPIKIIVSFAPGGVADNVARAFAAKLNETGKTAIVENRPGGGGVIGADAVAKSAPDGHTLYIGFNGTLSILPHLMGKLPYDAAKDFSPIILVATMGNLLIVHPSLPVRTVAELVAYAKANPSKLNVGSPGVGTSDHLASEQFGQDHGLKFALVHYKGAAPAMQDLMAGHVQMMFCIAPLALEQVSAGNVRALAVLSKDRMPSLPDVPTMAEAGVPGLEGGPWFGLMAPASTPRPIIEWLNAEARKAFSSPDVKARLEAQGLTLPLGSPEDFAKHIAAETLRWGDIIRKGNIKMGEASKP
jgi:tripartite-type tricarboxylate transporter receptor subunit TctC